MESPEYIGHPVKVSFGETPYEKKSLTAVLDTMQEHIVVPSALFDEFFKELLMPLVGAKNLDIRKVTDDNGTQIKSSQPCSMLEKSLPNMNFVLGGWQISMSPRAYLIDETDELDTRCVFAFKVFSIHGPPSLKEVIYLGKAFLKHFYLAIDYEQNQFGLAVDKNSA